MSESESFCHIYFQLQGSDKENLTEKYPSFELVLNFVKNDAISEEQVHFLLQQRAKFARCTDFAYSFASDYLQAIGTRAVFEVPSAYALLMFSVYYFANTSTYMYM